MSNTLTAEELAALLAQADDLRNRVDDDENPSWTWLDADPSVAWGDPESYHGKLAALYLDGGWEGCYHNESAVVHYNVKLNGMEGYRAFHARVDREKFTSEKAHTRIEEIADNLQQGDMEFWWEDDLPGFIHYENDGEGLGLRGVKVYGCGRQGGYVNCRELETNPDAMLKLGAWLGEQREYFNSAEYGEDLAERAIDEYKERQTAKLASPRIERIEA